MTPVEEYFTRRFMVLYGAPNTVDPAAFVAEYNKALAGTDADLLQIASDLVVKQHKFRNWPTVGECVEAVQITAVRRNQERAFSRWSTSRDDYVAPSSDARVRVAALVAEATATLKGA